jgi:hypothetical protein
MIRSYRAELVRLLRPRIVAVASALTLLFAVGGALIVVAAAKPIALTRDTRAPSIESLSHAGGGTEVFRTVASFMGTFVFVLFVGVIAVEFTRGTMRTMLLRQPRRVPLLVGKLGALLTFAACALFVGEVVAWAAARATAPGQGIVVAAWTSGSALAAAAGDYAAVLAWVTGYAVFATALAVGLRSVGLALGIGLFWSGPLEHLNQNAGAPIARGFPGLLLEAFAGGGTDQVTATRALTTAALYAVVAGTVAFVSFARRDVTA